MNRIIRIYCRNTGTYLDVEGGSTLGEALKASGIELGFSPICALVNNKTEHMGYPVFAPKEVEWLPACSAVGREVYTRSLCMMAYRALTALDRTLSLRIEHSVSRGLFCRLFGPGDTHVIPDAAFVSALEHEMQRLHALDLPFVRHEQLTRDVSAIFRRQGLDDKVLLLESMPSVYSSYYVLDGVADSFLGPLAPSTSHIGVFRLTPWEDGFLMLGPDPADQSKPVTPVAMPRMFEAFTRHLRFNRVVGLSSVGELNRAVAAKRTSELINVAEALHDKLLGHISDRILELRRQGGASVILIAGPSSSGKTTTSKRLAIQLMTNLIHPKLISLDDYFVDRVNTPLDKNGDYDYESLHALDLDRFNSDISALLKGETINLPTYSFELGQRIERDRPLKLDADDVLIVEGIHGLNPELTAKIPQKSIFKIYVSALTTMRVDNHNWISTSDTRLLRRIVRDYKYRGTSPVETIKRWPSVRRGEEKWIFPFQENADATFNSSLLFEIGVMKPYVRPLLEEVPHNVPEYTTAYRLLRFLGYFRPIPETQVPSTSLLREFLGGSSFHY